MISAAGRRPVGDRARLGAQHVRWTVRSRLAEHPGYLRIARRRHGDAVVSEATDLVIDGFTRSASTFAVVAFQLAQPQPVRVAHHLHAPSQIIHAVRLGVPALLTLRPPEDTVLSLVVREPYVTIPQGLTAYARFHARLLEHRAGMVVAGFDEVTGHLDRTIERLNARFGTDFAEFVHTDEHVRECFDLIETRARRPPWRQTIQDFLSGLVPLSELERVAASHRGAMPAVPEHRAQRPSAYKDERKNALRAAYHSAAHAAARRRAEELHALFTGDPTL